MNKFDVAQYLVNLSTLLSAQSSNVHNPSAVLSEEYNKHWGILKDIVIKENEDEARTRKLNEGRRETSDHLSRDQSMRSGEDRNDSRPRDPARSTGPSDH